MRNPSSLNVDHSSGLLDPVLDRQAIDVEECADTINHSPGPVAIHCSGEHKVRLQIQVLGVWRDLRETKGRQIHEHSTTDEWQKQDCPVRKWLSSQVMEDNLRGQPPEDKGHCQAEQSEMIVFEKVTVLRTKPRDNAASEDEE